MTAPADLGFDTDRLARLPARINADVEAGRYHGAALAVSRRGQTVYRDVHGYADRESGRPMTLEDVFVEIASGQSGESKQSVRESLHTPVGAGAEGEGADS